MSLISTRQANSAHGYAQNMLTQCQKCNLLYVSNSQLPLLIANILVFMIRTFQFMKLNEMCRYVLGAHELKTYVNSKPYNTIQTLMEDYYVTLDCKKNNCLPRISQK